MAMIDEHTKAELIREIATILARKQRLAFASDFHALVEGRTLILSPDTKCVRTGIHSLAERPIVWRVSPRRQTLECDKNAS